MNAGACLVSLVLTCAVGGCSGLGAIQQPTSQFDQAAHAASSAETAFLDAEQATECEDQFYKRALAYATAKLAGKDKIGRAHV